MRNRHPILKAPAPERTRPWWDKVRDLIRAFRAMIGAPEDVLARGEMTRKDYNVYNTMLRGIEALVRRLLLIEASDVEAPPPTSIVKSAPAAPPGLRAKSTAPKPADPAKPETWRVSFQLIPTQRRVAGPEPARLSAYTIAQENQYLDARPLARRFEALVRVFDARPHYVERLARRIACDHNIARAFLAAPKLPLWAAGTSLCETKRLLDLALSAMALNTS